MKSSSLLQTFSDNELLLHYKKSRSEEVFGILFKRYTHLVLGVCLKYLKDEDEAKDALMEIFEKLLTGLLRHEVSNFKSWLHSVAKNHCLMKLRASKSKFMVPINTEEEQFEVVEMNTLLHPEDGEEKETSLKLLEKGILGLNEEQQKCVRLFYIEEKSYKEVSDITGYDMLKVKSNIQNGKRNLKLFMERNNGKA